jgi:hypothetical protein
MNGTKYTVSKLKMWKTRDEGGYSCVLLRDGRPVAEVVNEGRGGPLDFTFAGQKNYTWFSAVTGDPSPDGCPEARAFAEHAKSQPPYEMFGETHAMTAEVYLEQLVQDAENLKKFHRQRRTHVIFVDGDKLFTARAQPNLGGYALVRARYGTGVQILNDKSDEEYLAAIAKCQ